MMKAVKNPVVTVVVALMLLGLAQVQAGAQEQSPPSGGTASPSHLSDQPAAAVPATSNTDATETAGNGANAAPGNTATGNTTTAGGTAADGAGTGNGIGTTDGTGAAESASVANDADLLNPALLPQDLSPAGMFMNADIVVKVVMLGLAFASVMTWTVFLVKAAELLLVRRRTLVAFGMLAEARSLASASESLTTARGPGVALLKAVEAELRLAADTSSDGLKERIASRLERVEAATSRAMTRGTGILATIGSTAPFVGLFGTVWGIMNSFIGISQAHTTNLAVVAPGIAEALLATAVGLVAAIPAVVIYNLFARLITANKAAVADTAAAVLRLVSRDFDRGAASFAKAAE